MDRPRCAICGQVLNLREALSGSLCDYCEESERIYAGQEEDQEEDEPEAPAWIRLFDLQGRKGTTPGMAVFYQNNY